MDRPPAIPGRRRRDAGLPAPHNVRAAVDPAADVDLSPMQEAWQAALDDALARWGDVTKGQVDALVEQIRDALAAGDLPALSALTVDSAEAAALLAEVMAEAAAASADHVVAEAEAQGATIEPTVPDTEEFTAAAATVAGLLAASLAISAGRAALRSRLEPDAAEQVGDLLRSFTDEQLREAIGAVLTSAQNTGRIATLRAADPPAVLYASEQLDTVTCEPCAAIAGRRFGTTDDLDFAEVEKTYPFTGYVGCKGRDRCRGTVVGVWPNKTEDHMDRTRLRMLAPGTKARDSYRITNNGDDAEVFIYDEIGMWGVEAYDFVAEFRAITAARIALHINSPGGEVYDGIAIYNAIRNHPATVTAHIDSLAASAASFIAQAANKVVMARNSEFMIHDASTMCWGNAEDMRSAVEQLDRVSDNIAGIYAERAGGTTAEWRERMRAETWYSAEEAVASGLADEVAAAEPRSGTTDRVHDLSVFKFAGRAKAPPPAISTPTAQLPAAPVPPTPVRWDSAAFAQQMREAVA